MAILKKLSRRGFLLAIDKDPDAILAAQQRFQGEQRFLIERGSFTLLKQLADRLGITGRVDGVLFDLGVSSPQFDDPQRGFSFLRDGPLDMRMDPHQGSSAAEWIALTSEKEMAAVFREYGEERYARQIARAIVENRSKNPIVTTGQLADLIVSVVPKREKYKHPATRTFQAIRIYINQELTELSIALEQSLKVLCRGGRLVVISFHSLEDRIVKRFLRDHTGKGKIPRRLPVTDNQISAKLRIIGKAIRASQVELQSNPRARSAILRVAERQ